MHDNAPEGRDNSVMNIAVMGTRGYPSTYSGYETFVRHFVPHAIEREKQAVDKEVHPPVRKSYLEQLQTLEKGKPIRGDGLDG